MIGARILLVDDEPSLLLTLSANLELEGFVVETADSGARALELLAAQPFDVVLSDVRMPGMNGVDLFGQIRRRFPQLPVILMTAYAMEELVNRALRGGIFTVLAKPASVEQVVDVITRACARSVVLVVDDIEEDAESTAEALRAVGLRALAVGNGRAAIAAVTAGAVDVCVTDLVMPGLDGVELTRRIQAIDPNITVVAVSGYSVPEMMTKVSAIGAIRCMRKPFDAGELLHTIARARARRQAAR